MFTRRQEYTPQKNGDARDMRALEFTPLGALGARSRPVGAKDASAALGDQSPPLVEYGRNVPFSSPIADVSLYEEDAENLSIAADTSLHYIPNNNGSANELTGVPAPAMQLGPPLKDSEQKAEALLHEINSLKIRNSMLKRLTSNIPLDSRRLVEENIGLKESILDLENKIEALRLRPKDTQRSHEADQLRQKVFDLTSRLNSEKESKDRLLAAGENHSASQLRRMEELLDQTQRAFEHEREQNATLLARLESSSRNGEESILATQQLQHTTEKLGLAERELESERRRNQALLARIETRDGSESTFQQNISKELTDLKQKLIDAERSAQEYKRENANLRHIREELTRSEALIRDLNGEIDALKNLRINVDQNASTDAHVLEGKLVHAHEELRTKDRENTHLKTRLNDSEQEVNEILKPRLESLQQELSIANRRCRDIDAQESELKWAKQEIRDLKDRCNQLQNNSADNSRANQELAALRDIHDKLQAAHQQLVRDHDRDVSASASEVSLLKRRVEESKQEQEILRRQCARQIDQLEREFQAKIEHDKSMQNKPGPDSDKIRRLSSENASLQAQLLDLNRTIKSLKVEKDKLRRECDDLNRRYDNLNLSQSDYNSHNQELVQVLEKTRDELATTKAALESAQKENEILVSKQRELLSKIDATTNNIEELNNEYRNHDYKTQELEQKLSITQQQLSVLQEEQRRQQGDTSRLSIDLREARRAASSAKDECESLKRRLATANGFLESVADSHATEGHLRDIRNQYEQEIEDLRHHLNSAEDLISKIQYLLDVEKPGDIEVDIKELLESNRYLRDQFRVLNSQIQDYENAKFVSEAAKKDVIDLTSHVNELRALLADKESQRLKLESDYERVQTVLDSVEARAQALEREDAQLRHDLERKLDKIAALELGSKLSLVTQQELSELRLSKKRDESRIRDLESELLVARNHESKVKELDAELRSARLDAASYRERVEKLQSMQHSDEKLDDALKVLLEMDLKESQLRSKKLETQLTNATDKIKEVQERLIDMESQLASAQAQNKIVSKETPELTITHQQLKRDVTRFKDELRTMSLYCNKLRGKLDQKVQEIAVLSQALDNARAEVRCKQAVIESEAESDKAKLYTLKAEYYEALFSKTATRVKELKQISRIANATVKSMTNQQLRDIAALTPVASPTLKPLHIKTAKPSFKTVAQFVLAVVKMKRRAREARLWYKKFEDLGISIERESLKFA